MIRRLFFANICLAWICVSSLFGQTTSDPLDQYIVSTQFSNQKLPEVLDQLASDYPVIFFFKEEWLPNTNISKSFQDTPLSQVLKDLLEPNNLGYVMYQNNGVIIGRKLDLAQLEVFSMLEYAAEKDNKEEELSAEGYERIFVGDSTIRPLPDQATVTGSIFNNDSEQGIAGSRLLVPALQLGANTDAQGNFSIKLPTGQHLVVLEAPGHETVRKQLNVYSDGEWDAPLAYSAFQLGEVLLQANSEAQEVRSATIGRINISMADVRSLPSLLGEADIINNILLLPGVSTVGESSSGFNVRGGNIDQNLIMQDGNMIFNSSHLLGFFSIFNPDVVQGATLYKGHMPADFGGRVSSVLDVEVQDGSFRNLQGQGSIGLFSSKASINGPIQKGRSSFLVGIRGAYPNLWTQYFNQISEIEQSSSYYLDLTAKVTQKIGENGKLSLFGYASTDFFRFSEDFGYDWSTRTGGLKYQQLINNNLSFNLRVNAGDYSSSIFNAGENLGFKTITGMRNYSAKSNFLLNLGEKHNISAGVEGNFYALRNLDTEPFGEITNVTPRTFDKDQGLELAFFINDEFELNPFISFSVGLRYSLFTNQGPFTVYDYAEGLPRLLTTITDSTVYGDGESIKNFSGLEPRVSARVLLNENASIKVSYNRVFQYLHLLSNTASSTPIDLWQVSNTYFPAQQADNFSLGIFGNFRGPIQQISLEGFYREMDGLVIAKDFARLFSAPFIETEVIPAIGRAYGGEFSLKGQAGDFEYNGSLSYIRSLRQTIPNPEGLTVNRGEWFPADFDTPWNGNLTLKYKVSRSKSISANFTYRSGRPVTVPTGGTLVIYPSWQIPTFSDRNTFRIPDYHRLDLAYTFEDGLIKRDRVKTDLTFSIYNVYARKNAFSVFFRKEGDNFKAFQLSVLGTVLPFMTYNIRF